MLHDDISSGRKQVVYHIGFWGMYHTWYRTGLGSIIFAILVIPLAIIIVLLVLAIIIGFGI